MNKNKYELLDKKDKAFLYLMPKNGTKMDRWVTIYEYLKTGDVRKRYACPVCGWRVAYSIRMGCSFFPSRCGGCGVELEVDYVDEEE